MARARRDFFAQFRSRVVGVFGGHQRRGRFFWSALETLALDCAFGAFAFAALAVSFGLYDLDRNALAFYRHLTSAEKERRSS